MKKYLAPGIIALIAAIALLGRIGPIGESASTTFLSPWVYVPLVAKDYGVALPTPLPTATPMPPPTPTPISCNGFVQVLQNPSFETGLAPWLINESVLHTNSRATDGSWSAMVAGYNSSASAIGQIGPVPTWAETAALYFDEFMISTDSSVDYYDALDVIVYDATTHATLAQGFIWNNAVRGTWIRWRLPVSDIVSWRGRYIGVTLAGFTDVSYPTAWYLDQVRFYFACGTAIAGESMEAPVPEADGRQYGEETPKGLFLKDAN